MDQIQTDYKTYVINGELQITAHEGYVISDDENDSTVKFVNRSIFSFFNMTQGKFK